MYQSNDKSIIIRQISIFALSLFIITLQISIFTFSTFAADKSAKEPKLVVDGKNIVSDVSPVIISSRTMIPARALFEEIGGKIDWNSKKKTVSISYNEHLILLTINSKNAKVDGKTKTMDVPAQIIKERSFIPLRFVAEALDFEVNWDPDTYTASVDTNNNTPEVIDNPVETLNPIKKVSVTAGSTTNMYTSVKIEFSDPITKDDYTENIISDPDRCYFDFNNVSVDNIYHETLYSTKDGHSSVKSVRAALYTLTTYRIVFDLNIVTKPTVSISDDNKIMTIKFNKNSNYKDETETVGTIPEEDEPDITASLEPKTPTTTGSTEPVNEASYNPYSDGKLVVALDPGHGKSTGGKRSPDGTLREYEFNRDVASRIKKILEKNGIEVLLTVEDDTDVSLANRCNLANNSAADIYVSIHANAFGNGIDWENNATGWEIYYYSPSNLGQTLANYIHKANMPDIGIKDRGVKTANFYVIKNTCMPAVLIEHGFFTSQTEVELLKSTSWRQKASELDAKGIMNFLYSYKK